MTSLGEIGAHLRIVLDKVDETLVAVNVAAEHAREAAELLQLVGQGSAHEAEYVQVAGQWSTAADGAGALVGLLDQVRATLERYLAWLELSANARPDRYAGLPRKEFEVSMLDVWYYRENQRAGDPATVASAAELDEILDYVLAHRQPHPPVLVVKERPTSGPLDLPDHQVKIDVDRTAGVGAILAMGPADFVVDADLPDGGVWVTKGEADAAALYIDTATLTKFPHDAAVPLGLWREALHELLRTGQRPTCVAWQESAVY